MPRFELSDQEAGLLRLLVESRLSTLTIEIAHTDSREFKDLLRRQRELLEGIERKLPPAPPG
jgi:hypothetical protein